MIRHFLKGATFSGISYYLLQDHLIAQTYHTNQTIKSLTQEFQQINSFEDTSITSLQASLQKPNYQSTFKEKIQLSWNQSLYELHSKVYNLNLGQLFQTVKSFGQHSNQSDSIQTNHKP
ncbi:uncharacterized protein MELLADRAFT_95101 [Melampsora larici-populina 98AG31]|uniref:Uncharacterized protein n=1 Tax=Melampsora larici-populina (strain 98AG31 / pathotype 3-4-7) TaxID=747676 RepID=F4RCN3_MELLP|nr:uncharacterized protein MELLADRAFT_95101 [Melampsora larici-populina 98AG31]EGG10018.1 hypothetical protein MELLADRAFT_95101 [Melampsora larici-populina 98AG31]